MKKTIHAFLLLLIIHVTCFVQAQPANPVVVSPQVNADNTVTFRYLSRSAKDVKLSGQFQQGAVAMTKDTSGVWSITVGPVKPDMYPYSFVVDGIPLADPRNSVIFP